MRFSNAAIPAGMAWSSPFVKWQGSLSEVPTIDLAADVTGRALAARQVDPAQLDGLVLGWTTPQKDIFYGAPVLATRLGAGALSGPMISQACATSVACLAAAAAAVEAGAGLQLVVAADRISNGPQILYPSPSAMGGSPVATNWVLESFARDPWAGTSMLAAGGLVAAESGISRPSPARPTRPTARQAPWSPPSSRPGNWRAARAWCRSSPPGSRGWRRATCRRRRYPRRSRH